MATQPLTAVTGEVDRRWQALVWAIFLASAAGADAPEAAPLDPALRAAIVDVVREELARRDEG